MKLIPFRAACQELFRITNGKTGTGYVIPYFIVQNRSAEISGNRELRSLSPFFFHRFLVLDRVGAFNSSGA
jgi:hypothetical protein